LWVSAGDHLEKNFVILFTEKSGRTTAGAAVFELDDDEETLLPETF
jgi:hypothetical protein